MNQTAFAKQQASVQAAIAAAGVRPAMEAIGLESVTRNQQEEANMNPAITVGTQLFVQMGSYGGCEIRTVRKVHKRYVEDSRGRCWNLPNLTERGRDGCSFSFCRIYDPTNARQAESLHFERLKNLRRDLTQAIQLCDDEPALAAALLMLKGKP